MIPKEQITAAKHADLPRTLQSLGVDLIRDGHGYYFREHDSLKLFRLKGIWLYKWWSRDGEVGDGIQYLQRHVGMSFPEAVQTLTVNKILPNDQNNAFEYQPGKAARQQWMSKKWQVKSEKLICAAQGNLLKPNGQERLCYLIEQRGLQIDTIRRHRLGWLPAKDHMPSKILIPCYDSHQRLIRIRFRIDHPRPGYERYRISKGSNCCSPFPLGLSCGKPVMLVESELDAILVAQQTGRQLAVLALGTTAVKLIPAMVRFLNESVPLILISLDNDPGGRQKTASLINELKNTIDWPIPERYGKDVGEAWKQMSISKWIEAGLKKYCLKNE